MGNLGITELLLIGLALLIFFGPSELPELGKSLGKSINEFKKASTELQNTLEREIETEDRKDREDKAKAAPVILSQENLAATGA